MSYGQSFSERDAYVAVDPTSMLLMGAPSRMLPNVSYAATALLRGGERAQHKTQHTAAAAHRLPLLCVRTAFVGKAVLLPVLLY